MKDSRLTSNKPADTSAQEAEIDRHVYALYRPSPRLRPAGGLTPAEIKLIEESAAPNASVT
jgi:hypothetical protein